MTRSADTHLKHAFTSDPLRLSVPPLSQPAIQLLHSFILWHLVSMDPFKKDLGLWALCVAMPPLLIINLSSLPPLLKQLGCALSVFMWPSRSFCVHCNLTAMLFALDCYNSVILDSILDEYLLKHSKDLFTRHGLYYSEVPILGFVPFSPLGQDCLPILLLLHNRWSWLYLHPCSANLLPPVEQII